MKKIYLIAGEPSGDLLGSRLMRAIKKQTAGEVEFYGVGGDTMQREGLKSLFDISDLAIMGLLEVIPSIPKVLRHIKNTVDDIIRLQPDVVVTIDSWSFSARVHKALRKKKTNIPQIHYVAPQVWAWKKKRAKTMYKYIDRLLTLFPYEPKYFTPYHLPTDFIGHPVIESEAVNANADAFYQKFSIPKDKKIITVLPGSRKTEVSRLLPVFIQAVEQIHKEHPEFYFAIPTVSTVAEYVKAGIKNCQLPIVVTETENDRYNAFKASSAAIAASGTVALELAILGVPHIVGYKVSPFSAWLAKKFLKIEFVNLSNILLGREIVPELLQERCIPINIRTYIEQILRQDTLYAKQIDGFTKVREVLGFGCHTPSENAATIILNEKK